MDYKKISVLIVTYKQADVIGRNIESILRQKEYGLHEIVICDDCSPDNNWDVIQSYVQKYPNIIRAYRNNPNMGIYGNSNKLITLAGDADLFCWVEGDDALCDGFFKNAQETIASKNIDTTKRICIQANYKSVTTDGKEYIAGNSYLSENKCKPISAKLRALTTWRATLFSKAVLDNFKPSILDRGLALAESMFDSEWFVNLDKVYYIDCIGSIYYTGIGVSVDLGDDDCDFLTTEAMSKWDYWVNNEALGHEDRLYAKSQYLLAKLRTSHALSDYVSYAYYYWRGNRSFPFSLRSVVANFRYCTQKNKK